MLQQRSFTVQVSEVTDQTIEINNIDEIPAGFEREAEAAFVLEPARGWDKIKPSLPRFSPEVFSQSLVPGNCRRIWCLSLQLLCSD